MSKKVSIIIANWNGKSLLKECIPSVIEAVKFNGNDHEIIIVDDGSTDDSVIFVKSNYPLVRVIELKKNRGFASAGNTGVANSNHPIVILLNNDVVVKKDFIKPLIESFYDDNIFAVGPKVLWKNEDNKEVIYFGKAEACFKYGMFRVKYPWEIDSDKMEYPGVSLYAGGGFAAFDKNKFLEIGGFDEIYYPFYFEDLDLSYRAWKRGWKVLYAPQSIVFHKHQGTIGKNFKEDVVKCIEKKNALIFVWKNITDNRFMVQHIFFLLLRLVWWIVTGNITYIKSLIYACKQLSKILAARSRERQYHLPDRAIIKIINEE